MTFFLAEEAKVAGYRVTSFETIGSTSTEALARARTGETGPLWLAARHQSAGRGRRGNAWSTERGNLAASLLITTDASPATIATLGFVAGVALVEALQRCASFEARSLRSLAPQDEERRSFTNSPHAEARAVASLEARTTFALKWPNDVLANGAKLAGILLETEKLAEGCHAAVIGIGVNVADAPGGLPYPTTALAALGLSITPEELFAALTGAWLDAFAVWDEGRGFASIRHRWLARAGGLGAPIRVRLPRQELAGIFEAIDESGRLMLRVTDGSVTTISAGDVHFPAAAA